uniref:E3 SUMO-protein ligase RanBP2-like n=1 Tax=Styela clava TaxID=7725 RepID=UPI00193A970E|nr:E3 SUMO-protein ligase RanBP2-like [Styela clava]
MVDHLPPLIENEKSYANWKKAIKLWSIATNVPKSNQAIVVALSLQDKARELALEIEESVLRSENGIRELLKKLDITYKELKADCFSAFLDFDSCVRWPSEAMAAYITRFENRHSRLKMFQTSISDDMLGLKLLAGARLSTSESQKILNNDNTEWSMSTISRILRDISGSANVFDFTIPNSWSSSFPTHVDTDSRIFQSKSKPEVAQSSKFTFSKPVFGNVGLSSTDSKNFQSKQKPAAAEASKFTFSYSVSGNDSFSSTVRNKKNDDVIFVSEVKPTEDQRTRAEKLLLPSTFYLYENRISCDFDERLEEEKEDKILKYIHDRDNGKLNYKLQHYPACADSSMTTTVTSITSSTHTSTSATSSSFKLSTISTTTSQTMSQSVSQTQAYSKKGMLIADKKAGAWNCFDCYAQNGPTDSKCLCCGTPNLSAPKVEEAKGKPFASKFGTSSKPTGFEEKKEIVLKSVVEQLAKLTTLVSELQERKEVAESVKYQKQQEAMQLQLQQLQAQVNQSQFATPIALGRVVHLTQSEGQMPGRPMHQSNGGSSALQPAPPELQRRREINYPEHINFPDNNSWNYKFQTPEEMDKANDKLKADEEAEDAKTSQNDTGPHFEPIVRLSEVEIRTGEEDEEAVFSESAKLYRWTEGQWKERGVGVMKILKHKEIGKYRILMRRDQILKICCNHLIGKDLELQAMPKSDKAWIWHALDFSEEESKQEGFAIRFKTSELAHSFKEKFTEGKEIKIKHSGGTPVRASTTVKVTSHKPASTVDTLPKTTNSIMAQGETKSSTNDVTIPKFSFAFPKPSAAAANLAAKIAGSPQKVVSTADQETKPESSNNDDDQNEDIHNESGDGPHFEPIVKLPDNFETKTGEEDEQVLYCHRVKLYKYTDKQWKEKGVGEMKILHNAGTKKSRIVMRRDQVLKLCANHYIIPEMKFSHLGNSDKAWTWTAVDHSDPDVEPKPEVLAVRFKTAGEASDFVKVVNQAKDILQGKDVSSLTTTVSFIKLSTQTTATTSSFKLSTVSTTTSQTTPQSIAQTQVSSTKGMLVVDKKAGAWNCSGCYALNEPTDSKCPCCGVPNPSAPKVEETKPSASTFAFGISSKPTGFSFGIPSTNASVSKPIFGNQQPVQSNSATLRFGSTGFTFGQNKSTSVTAVSTTSVFGVQTSEKSDTASTAATIPEPSVSQVSTTGVLKVTKKVGSWRCESCYVENEQDNANCQYCGQANPNATQAPAGEAKPGLFGMNTNQGSKFSFGISSQPTVSSTKTSSSIVSPPKFMFGESDASSSFGFNQQQQTSNLFSNLSSTAPKSTSSTTGQLPKPRFPSVGDEEDSDEDEDDEDYTDGTSLYYVMLKNTKSRPPNQGWPTRSSCTCCCLHRVYLNHLVNYDSSCFDSTYDYSLCILLCRRYTSAFVNFTV